MEPNETIKEIAEKWAWDVAFRILRGVLKRYYSPPDSGTWLIGVFSGLEPNGELFGAIAEEATVLSGGVNKTSGNLVKKQRA